MPLAAARALRKHWGLRLLGLSVALLLVFGQLASVGHLALVNHGVCAEHGEAVHGDEAAHPAPERSANGIEGISRGAADGELGHEHCEHIARPRELAGLPLATMSLVAPPVHGLACVEPNDVDVARPRLPTLSVAPKQSPPLV